MELKHKLKQLRTDRNMTQEAVAEALGVSSQTVSKWERGLLSPDINLLPKIALLFKCSIDFLFDMGFAWGIDHRREFEAKLHGLHEKKDWIGVYNAWIEEIDLNPTTYKNYPDVMIHVFRKKLYDNGRVEKMISLAERAEKCCPNDDIRNEIYRIMLQICSEADDPKIKEKGKYYYQKLPQLRHSREVYASFVMDGDAYRTQLLRNMIYATDLVECSIRQLILPDMLPKEKLFYYLKAAALYETILDGKYAGFYDPPLLCDYLKIAVLYEQMGQRDKAEEYVHRIVCMLERHMIASEHSNQSKLLYTTTPANAVSTEQLCQNFLQQTIEIDELGEFRPILLDLQKRYNDYVASQNTKP